MTEKVSKTSMADFEVGKKLGIRACNYIGDGAYSVVYKAIRKSDEKVYALKKVNILHNFRSVSGRCLIRRNKTP